MIRWLVGCVIAVSGVALVAGAAASAATLVPPTTGMTIAGTDAFTYDAPANARVSDQSSGFAAADKMQTKGAQEGSASVPVEARSRSTAPLANCIATEAAGSAGYSASKINITDDGLAHVFDRHLADGSLSAGKSLFNDNVTLTRLIADAGDAVVPITQRNGSLAYVVDAGRNIGVDRATGLPTSTYTVITKPSGDLVTAFPGSP
jgi:hypothetical protein